jgi:hypothetical protein
VEGSRVPEVRAGGRGGQHSHKRVLLLYAAPPTRLVTLTTRCVTVNESRLSRSTIEIPGVSRALRTRNSQELVGGKHAIHCSHSSEIQICNNTKYTAG